MPEYAIKKRTTEIERLLHIGYLRARRRYGPTVDPNRALELDPTYEGLVIEWKVLREQLWSQGCVYFLSWPEAVAARIEGRPPVWECNK